MTARGSFWALFALTLGIYATMLTWTLPAIAQAAAGLAPFDMRPGGYGFDEARKFLAALSPEGLGLYFGAQQQLDIFYPALLSATMFWALSALLPRGLGRWRFLAATPALVVAGFDYLENHAIAEMLHAGATGLTIDMVQTASQWTQLKAQSTTSVMSALLVLIAWWLVATRLRRRALA